MMSKVKYRCGCGACTYYITADKVMRVDHSVTQQPKYQEAKKQTDSPTAQSVKPITGLMFGTYN